MAEKFNEALKDAAKTEAMSVAKKIGDAQLIFDIGGIFDPSPICDGVSVAMSLYQGEWIDAGLGAISLIPYIGDAFAKPIKFARKFGKPGERLAELTNAWMKGKTDDLLKALKHDPKAIEDARKKAAKAVQDAQQKKRLGCNTEECKKLRNSNMPNAKTGQRWDPPNAKDTGTGKFIFKDKNGIEHTVPYKDGYPDFSNYTSPEGKFYLSNPSKDGNVYHDTKNLFAENPGKFPNGQPQGTTLHHFEDGSVGFVDKEIHDIAKHTGFRSIQNTDLY